MGLRGKGSPVFQMKLGPSVVLILESVARKVGFNSRDRQWGSFSGRGCGCRINIEPDPFSGGTT